MIQSNYKPKIVTMTKLFCSKKGIAGQSFHFPIIGDVTFNKDSVIQVEDELVKSFLKVQCGFNFEILDGKSKKKKDTDNDDNMSKGSDVEKEAYINELGLLTNKELDALMSIHPEIEVKEAGPRKQNKIDFLAAKQFSA